MWFSKHLKFCGRNTEIAHAIVGPEEEDSGPEEEILSKSRVAAPGGVPKRKKGQRDLEKESAELLHIRGGEAICTGTLAGISFSDSRLG